MSLLCKRCDNPVDELDFEKGDHYEKFGWYVVCRSDAEMPLLRAFL